MDNRSYAQQGEKCSTLYIAQEDSKSAGVLGKIGDAVEKLYVPVYIHMYGYGYYDMIRNGTVPMWVLRHNPTQLLVLEYLR